MCFHPEQVHNHTSENGTKDNYIGTSKANEAPENNPEQQTWSGELMITRAEEVR